MKNLFGNLEFGDKARTKGDVDVVFLRRVYRPAGRGGSYAVFAAANGETYRYSMDGRIFDGKYSDIMDIDAISMRRH